VRATTRATKQAGVAAIVPEVASRRVGVGEGFACPPCCLIYFSSELGPLTLYSVHSLDIVDQSRHDDMINQNNVQGIMI
jgi:hypothetical protein